MRNFVQGSDEEQTILEQQQSNGQNVHLKLQYCSSRSRPLGLRTMQMGLTLGPQTKRMLLRDLVVIKATQLLLGVDHPIHDEMHILILFICPLYEISQFSTNV